MNRMILPLTVVLMITAILSFTVKAEPGQNEQNKISLAIYSTTNPGNIRPELYQPVSDNEGGVFAIPGYAIVHERREIDLKQGKNTLDVTNIPVYIDPTTVTFRSLTDPSGSKILEQSYNYDLLNKKKLLQRYLGQDITVEQNQGNRIETVTGKLLSATDALVLQDKTGQYVTLNDYANVRFGVLPGGLTMKPTLTWAINASKTGKQKIETSYQTSGLTWWADYHALFEEGKDPNSGFLNLSAWVSIVNKSGISYENAKLKLIAGNVNRIQKAMPFVLMASKASSRPENGFAEQSFFDYYAYSLARETTIADNTTKQIELFSAVPRIPVMKEYLYQGVRPMEYASGANGNFNTTREFPGQENHQVNIYLKFNNGQEQGLGMPLPAGRIRVAKVDEQNAVPEFIGEDLLQHQAKDEKISIKLGNSFDVVGDRKQTNFSVDTDRHVLKETFEIKIRNHKDQAINVIVREPLYRGGNWKIIENSRDYQKTEAQVIEFPIQVSKNGETKLNYTVEYTW